MDEARPYLDPYLKAAAEMGPGFGALLWHSPKAQKTRFRVIARMARTKGRVVADIGCGNADLLLDLHRRGRTPGRYIGVDGVPEMLGEAGRQAAGAGIDAVEWVEGDFVGDAGLMRRLVDERGVEVLVFCGSLNTLAQDDALGVLDRAWSAVSRRAGGTLVYNFLSIRHDRARTPAQPPAVRFDPVAMLAWSLDRTPLTTFRHDYLGGHDATVCMRVRG